MSGKVLTLHNLALDVTRSKVSTHCAKVLLGNRKGIAAHLEKNPDGSNTGRATVRFTTRAEAASAARKLHDTTIDGRTVLTLVADGPNQAVAAPTSEGAVRPRGRRRRARSLGRGAARRGRTRTTSASSTVKSRSSESRRRALRGSRTSSSRPRTYNAGRPPEASSSRRCPRPTTTRRARSAWSGNRTTASTAPRATNSASPASSSGSAASRTAARAASSPSRRPSAWGRASRRRRRATKSCRRSRRVWGTRRRRRRPCPGRRRRRRPGRPGRTRSARRIGPWPSFCGRWTSRTSTRRSSPRTRRHRRPVLARGLRDLGVPIGQVARSRVRELHPECSPRASCVPHTAPFRPPPPPTGAATTLTNPSTTNARAATARSSRPRDRRRATGTDFDTAPRRVCRRASSAVRSRFESISEWPVTEAAGRRVASSAGPALREVRWPTPGLNSTPRPRLRGPPL